MSYEIIISNIVDLLFIRHPSSAHTKDAPIPIWIINYFSSIITKDNTNFFESLLTIPNLSNSFCGPIVTPRQQNWWLQTKPSKGNFYFHFHWFNLMDRHILFSLFLHTFVSAKVLLLCSRQKEWVSTRKIVWYSWSYSKYYQQCARSSTWFTRQSAWFTRWSAWVMSYGS